MMQPLIGLLENVVSRLSSLFQTISARFVIWLLFLFSSLYVFEYNIYQVKQLMAQTTSRAVKLVQQTADGLADFLITNPNLQNQISILIGAVALLYLAWVLSRYRVYMARLRLWGQQLGETVGEVFRVGFYRGMGKSLDQRFSLGAYFVLLWLWDTLRPLEFLRNGELLRKRIRHRVTLWRKQAAPLYTVLQRLLPFLHRENVQPIRKAINELMDEGKQLSRLEQVPEDILALFAESEAPFIPEAWRSQADEVFNRWQSGLISGLLLRGGNGSGKSTFLRYIKWRYQDSGLHHVVLERGKHPLETAFFRRLQRAPVANLDRIPRQIVILDDLEHLFLRRIGGFDTFRNLLLLVERTKSRILWVTAASRVFCDYMRNIFPIESVFQFIIDGPFVPRAEITPLFQTILARGGYGFRVLMDQELYQEVQRKIRRKVISKTEIESYLRQLFVNRCCEVGGNNLHFHKYFFLRSLRSIHSGQLYLNMPQFFQLPVVNDLETDQLLVLHSLCLHKSLSKEDLVEILLQTPEQVSLALSMFYEHNLIEKKGDLFSVFPPIHNQLLRFLETKNLIKGHYD